MCTQTVQQQIAIAHLDLGAKRPGRRRVGRNTTLVKKYKEKPLADAVRLLLREVLEHLELPIDDVKLDFGALNGLNGLLRKVS